MKKVTIQDVGAGGPEGDPTAIQWADYYLERAVADVSSCPFKASAKITIVVEVKKAVAEDGFMIFGDVKYSPPKQKVNSFGARLVNGELVSPESMQASLYQENGEARLEIVNPETGEVENAQEHIVGIVNKEFRPAKRRTQK